MALFDLTLDTSPGPYLPRSGHIAMVHGHTIAGIGYTPPPGQLQNRDDIVIVHELEGIPVGATSIDATPAAYAWGPHLHKPRTPAA